MDIYDLLLVCNCIFMLYHYTLKNIMTLKSRLAVTQRHWKLHNSITSIRVPIGVIHITSLNIYGA